MLIHVIFSAQSVLQARLNSGSGACGTAQMWWVRCFYAMGVRCCGQLVMVDCGIVVGEEKGRERKRETKRGQIKEEDEGWCRYTAARLAHGVDLGVRVVVQLTSEGQLKLLCECSSASVWSGE